MQKLSRFWQKLVNPHPRIAHSEVRERSQLFAGMLIVMAMVLLFIITIAGILNGRDLLNPAAMAAYLLIGLCCTLYFVNRAGYFNIAVWTFILFISFFTVLIPYVPGAAWGVAPFAIVPIVLVGIFYGAKWIYVATILILTSTFILNQLSRSSIAFWELQLDWYFQLFAAGLIVVFMNHLQRLEHIRRQKLETANRQLRESEELLEQRVQERTQELQQAYQKVEALNRVKDEFVSNVSHELRTPITSMKLQNYLLKQTISQEERVHADILGHEIQRLNTLIESLLMLSRLDQQRIELQIEPLNLNQMVAGHVIDRYPLAIDKRLQLKTRLCQTDLWVHADKNLLEQVLSILLTNAMNYTQPGGEIIVQTEPIIANPTQSWGKFSVQDTGIGIPPHEQQELFSRFFRGTSAQDTKVEGTGLGLSIAKQIIDQHRGNITVESSGIPGEGTTFHVQIPMLLS